jgi:hypothetical protein
MLLSEEEFKENEIFFKNKFVKSCDICHGRGSTIKEYGDYEVSTTCSCVKKAKLYTELIDYGIPKKYLVAKYNIDEIKNSSYGEDLKNYTVNFVENYQNSVDLFVLGYSNVIWKVGSFLVRHISKLQNPDFPKSRFKIGYSLFSDILKMSFDDRAATANNLLYKTDVLIIDGIGSEFGRNDNKFSQRFLENTIKKRDNDCKLTIMFTNFSMCTVKEMYDNEVCNFIDNCKIINTFKDDKTF